eukprot:m.354083 g.354083  ORF g.354083 m.354083 type:complete len:668 (+) comp55932_c0_seq5:97-2100(+)
MELEIVAGRSTELPAGDHDVVEINLDDMRAQHLISAAPAKPAAQPEPVALVSATSAVDVTSKTKLALTWHNLTYRVQEKKKDKTGVYPMKTILYNVSGAVKSGDLLALMGPSGSGKTTLLDLLADRISSGQREGEVRVNGRPRGKTFKHYAAYVQQEDCLFGMMTVRETFKFVQELTRLPGATNEQEEARIDHVLQMLGLKGVENVRIGTIFLKGISGGQKRRVSMGLELLTNPAVLFLDEPTSGLDSASSFKVVEHLQELAAEGMTILCTVHQPSSEVYHMFSKLLIMAGGRTCYFGHVDTALQHFAEAGFPAPRHSNPADFFMTLVNTDFVDTQIEQFEHATPADSHGPKLRRNSSRSEANFPELYERSSYHRTNIEEIEAVRGAAQGKNLQTTELAHPGFAVGPEVQFWVLLKRRFLDNARNPLIFWVRAAMFIMLSLMIGTMYISLGTDEDEIQDRISVLAYVFCFLVFMSIAVVPAFIEDRAIFLRERGNGYYSVAVHVIVDSIATIPGLFFIALVCTLIMYWMLHLHCGFGIFLMDLFMALYVAEGLLAFISACVPHYIIGMALGAGVYGMFMLCMGFFIIPSNIPPWWYYWAYYIGFHTYFFRIAIFNEFNNQSWGEETLKRLEMEDSDTGLDFGVLIIMAFGYRLCYFLVMYYFRTGRR